MRFNYEGFDALSCVKRGWIEGASIEDASARLREMKIFVQNISPDGVPARNVLPDEKASESNFPTEQAPPRPMDDEDGGYMRIYNPTKAGETAQPDTSEGRAKVYNPFAKEHQAPIRPATPAMDPDAWKQFSGTCMPAAINHPQFSGTQKNHPDQVPAEPAGSKDVGWEQQLTADVQVARQVVGAIGKLSLSGESEWKAWAAKALIEQAARVAAYRISRD